MRRRALLCLAVPAVLAGRQASALRAQPAAPELARDWAARCGGAAPTAGVPAAICPFCGCPVYGGRDHGEAALPPRG